MDLVQSSFFSFPFLGYFQHISLYMKVHLEYWVTPPGTLCYTPCGTQQVVLDSFTS